MTKILLHNFTLAAIADGEGPLLGDGLGSWQEMQGQAILIEGGKVSEVGASAALLDAHPDAQVKDLGARLLSPGLIDSHTHPAFVGTRAKEFRMRLEGQSYEAILAAGGGIHNSVAALRDADDQRLWTETKKHLGWLKEHGVVACEGKSGYGLSLRDERRSLAAIHDAAANLGMHVEGTCLAAHVVPKEYSGRRGEYLDLVVNEIAPALTEAKLVSALDIFVEENAFESEDLRRVMACAEELGLGVHVHADQLSAGDGAKIAAELGALSIDHCEYTTKETMQAMAKANTCALLLPGSTFVLGQDQWAPAREMVDAGVPVVLATDFNPGSSPIMNPAFVMSLACLKLGLTPKEALAAFTRNAAYCLRIEGQYGSITVGKRAAFTLWDCKSVDEIPYWVGANLAETLIF